MAAERHSGGGLGREAARGHVSVELGVVRHAHPRAGGTKLDPQRVAERLHRGLGSAVRRHQRQVDCRGERCGEQEVAARMGHVRRRRADKVVAAGEVDGEGGVPDRGVAIDEGHLSANPCIGHGYVEPAEL